MGLSLDFWEDMCILFNPVYEQTTACIEDLGVCQQMRSKIEANEYKDYILGFIFYKFLSDKEVKFLKENDWTDDDLPHVTEDDAETVDYIRSNVGYFISYKHLFSTWIDKGSDFS